MVVDTKNTISFTSWEVIEELQKTIEGRRNFRIADPMYSAEVKNLDLDDVSLVKNILRNELRIKGGSEVLVADDKTMSLKINFKSEDLKKFDKLGLSLPEVADIPQREDSIITLDQSSSLIKASRKIAHKLHLFRDREYSDLAGKFVDLAIDLEAIRREGRSVSANRAIDLVAETRDKNVPDPDVKRYLMTFNSLSVGQSTQRG